jgi:hypothetical protein
MKTYDFINQAIGQQVYITGDGDLAFSGHLRGFIFHKTPLTLVKLSKAGMAVLEYEGELFTIPPRNVREYSELQK